MALGLEGKGKLRGAHRLRPHCKHGLWGRMYVHTQSTSCVQDKSPATQQEFSKAGSGLVDLCVYACVCSHMHVMRGKRGRQGRLADHSHSE